MASEFEESGVERQGYFRLGFGSFMPHNPQQLLAKRRNNVRQPQSHIKGRVPHKQAHSLPAIHVSKLKERPSRKLTQSLKPSVASEMPGNADCNYCYNTNKKRLLPSLADSCVLPKMVCQGSSWWEWSKKEYRIKQTKFSHETDVGSSLEGVGQGSSNLFAGGDTIKSLSEWDNPNLTSLAKGHTSGTSTDNLQQEGNSSLSSHGPLLSRSQGKVPIFSSGSEDTTKSQYYFSQSKAGLQPLAQRRPMNNINVFDFNAISEHRPAYRKWSKLTALPHIYTGGPSHGIPEYHISEYQWGELGENGTDRQSQSLADGTDTSATSFSNTSSSITHSGPVYSIQNITLRNDLGMAPERKLPIRKFQQSDREYPYHSSILSTRSDVTDSESSDPEAYEGHNHHEWSVKPHRKEGQHSTTTMANSQLKTRTRREGKAQLPDLRNAVIINNWIKILESTKETDGDYLYPELAQGTDHKDEHSVNFRQSLLRKVQDKVANINLSRFFDQPESVMREYDRIRHLSQFTSQDSSSPHSQTSFDGANEEVISTEMRLAKNIVDSQHHVTQQRGVSEDASQRHHIKWLPSPTKKSEHGGLADLLAVQALRTKNLSSDEMKPCNAEDHVADLSRKTDGTSRYSLPQRLHITVDNTPKRMKDSIKVDAISNPLPPKHQSATNTTPSDQDKGGNLNEQHLQEPLLHVAQPVPEMVKVRGHKKKQGKIQKAKHYHPYPHDIQREVADNLYPDLVIVGSSALDLSELKWREEVKSLIRLVAKSKGLTKHQLKKLEHIYSYLQSDPNDCVMSSGDNPEDFLKKLLAPNIEMGINNDGLFYFDESLVGTGGLSSSEGWNLACDDEWLEKQDIDALLSKADTIKDPEILKKLIVEKIRRETGITGKDKDELMEYVNKNVCVLVDAESGRRIPVIPPSLAKILVRKTSGTHQDSVFKDSNTADGAKADLLSLLRGGGQSNGSDEGLYFDFASGIARNLDDIASDGNIKLVLDPLEVDDDGTIPGQLPSYIKRNIRHGGRRRKRGVKGEEGGEWRRTRRRRGIDGEESASELGDESKRRRRRRERRRNEDLGSDEGEEAREERRRKRRERRKRRREEGLESDEEDREERRRRRKERRKRRREEGLESDEDDDEAREERRRRRKERRKRRREEGLESDEEDDEAREERRRRLKERRKRRREEGLESDEEDDEAREERRRRRKERRKRRREEGLESDENDDEAREERRRRRKERRKRRREGGLESDEDDEDSVEEQQRRRGKRRRRREESEDSDEDGGKRRRQRRHRQGYSEGESDSDRKERRKRRKERKQKGDSAEDDNYSSSDSYDSDTDTSYDSYYDSSSYSSDYSDYSSYSEESGIYHGGKNWKQGKSGLKKQHTKSKLKEYRRVFNSTKTSLNLADGKSNKGKRRRLGIVKAEEDARGSGRGGAQPSDSPLFKGAMLKEIGEVMDIVKTIQETVTLSRPSTVQRVGSTASELRGDNLPSSKQSSRGQLSRKGRTDGGSSGNASLQPQKDADILSSGEEEANKDLKEKMEKEKRMKELEEEMAGDLDRQWNEVARQRKLKAEAKVKVEVLEKERARLVEQQEKATAEKRAKEKEHHAAMLEKFRAEGIYRQYLHRNEQEIVREYERINSVWSEVDYAAISFYLGEEYAAEVRRAEKIKEQQARAQYEQQLQEALDFQRNELLDSLRSTQQDMLLGTRVNTVDMCHLLEISRAFVYSYFDNVVDIICS